ncbi:MAG: imidazole glycerol phosphate synthase subunit HisH [Clostridium sp.]
MIGIIDYGMGNLKSVSNALDKLCVEYIISDDKEFLGSCEKLILPGVGAFNDAMINLKEKGLDEFIKIEALKGKELLGICLGMQLLFEKSYEGIEMDGLGLLKGTVVKINEEGRRIPHIGWNSGKAFNKTRLLDEIDESSFFYYVHSYMISDYEKDDLVIGADYEGVLIPGLFRRGNIVGAQFHPEKSGEVGLKLIENFVKG